jgi:hypothetical protein
MFAFLYGAVVRVLVLRPAARRYNWSHPPPAHPPVPRR